MSGALACHDCSTRRQARKGLDRLLLLHPASCALEDQSLCTYSFANPLRCVRWTHHHLAGRSLAFERVMSDSSVAMHGGGWGSSGGGNTASSGSGIIGSISYEPVGLHRSDSIQLLQSALKGIKQGARPTAIEVGNLSGVYTLYDGTLSPVAVFKPRDEEFAADAGELDKFELGA